jgi:hypothetical protein
MKSRANSELALAKRFKARAGRGHWLINHVALPS